MRSYAAVSRIPVGRRASHRCGCRRHGTLAHNVAGVATCCLPDAISTVISDVATTGNSGSGVFDAGSKCVLGITSRKIQILPSDTDAPGEPTDLAKYFVPASTITAFIPSEYRF
jgi:hypothetical protein